MQLHELAIACYAFDALTGYNRAYTELAEATALAPDLARPKHRLAVLRFLRRWGCRHLAVEHVGSQSEALRRWYSEWALALPPRVCKAWDLSDDQLDRAAEAYRALAASRAHDSRTVRGGRSVPIGATAAGKVLFVLRPHAFPPPDEATRKSMKLMGLADNYRGIIGWVRDECRELEAQ